MAKHRFKKSDRFKKIARFNAILGLALCACVAIIPITNFAASNSSTGTAKVFYRYTDDKGGKALSLTIPPEAIARGYEIVSLSGDVLKTVAPTANIDPVVAEQQRKTAKELAKLDSELRRDYSSPQDIESAKERKLRELNSTVEILSGSLVSAQSQLKLRETNAANIERSGRKVPDDLLKNITTLREQEKEIQHQLQSRKSEIKSAADKFDADKTRFILITGKADSSTSNSRAASSAAAK